MSVRSRRKVVVLGSPVRSITSVRVSSSSRWRKALSTSQARSTVCDSLRSPLRRLLPLEAASSSSSSCEGLWRESRFSAITANRVHSVLRNLQGRYSGFWSGGRDGRRGDDAISAGGDRDAEIGMVLSEGKHAIGNEGRLAIDSDGLRVVCGDGNGGGTVGRNNEVKDDLPAVAPPVALDGAER